jgi:hypothetical protein
MKQMLRKQQSIEHPKKCEQSGACTTVFYNQKKGGVVSHDQMCSLYTTARKTNRWPMRLFL